MPPSRFMGVASAKELSASDTARASHCETQCDPQSPTPPATRTSPLSLNRGAPHPHMDASTPNVADMGRCLCGETGQFSSNVLSQRLPCLTACAGRPAPSLSRNSSPLSFGSLRRTAFKEK
ncbi:hypothetical protein TRVL_06899 [Trypanosoma vivax]|nr:hypothetical protein TRVL_06899 [Trypanosoma vivax]